MLRDFQNHHTLPSLTPQNFKEMDWFLHTDTIREHGEKKYLVEILQVKSLEEETTLF